MQTSFNLGLLQVFSVLLTHSQLSVLEALELFSEIVKHPVNLIFKCQLLCCEKHRRPLLPTYMTAGQTMLALTHSSLRIHLGIPFLPQGHLFPLKCQLSPQPAPEQAELQSEKLVFKGSSNTPAYLHNLITACRRRIGLDICAVVDGEKAVVAGQEGYFSLEWNHVSTTPNSWEVDR